MSQRVRLAVPVTSQVVGGTNERRGERTCFEAFICSFNAALIDYCALFSSVATRGLNTTRFEKRALPVEQNWDRLCNLPGSRLSS